MELFVLRHGEAEAVAGADNGRALTPAGLSKTREILLRNVHQLQSVTRLCASPYLRARQTAQLAAEQLSLQVETVDQLTPDNGVVPLCDWLQQQGESTLLLVSHQPLVGNLVDWLTGAPRGKYFMGTSALACLRYEIPARNSAELCWLRQPES